MADCDEQGRGRRVCPHTRMARIEEEINTESLFDWSGGKLLPVKLHHTTRSPKTLIRMRGEGFAL